MIERDLDSTFFLMLLQFLHRDFRKYFLSLTDGLTEKTADIDGTIENIFWLDLKQEEMCSIFHLERFEALQLENYQ